MIQELSKEDLTPFAHEPSTSGRDLFCAPDCPACRWVADIAAVEREFEDLF